MAEQQSQSSSTLMPTFRGEGKDIVHMGGPNLRRGPKDKNYLCAASRTTLRPACVCREGVEFGFEGNRRIMSGESVRLWFETVHQVVGCGSQSRFDTKDQ